MVSLLHDSHWNTATLRSDGSSRLVTKCRLHLSVAGVTGQGQVQDTFAVRSEPPQCNSLGSQCLKRHRANGLGAAIVPHNGIIQDRYLATQAGLWDMLQKLAI